MLVDIVGGAGPDRSSERVVVPFLCLAYMSCLWGEVAEASGSSARVVVSRGGGCGGGGGVYFYPVILSVAPALASLSPHVLS